MYVSPRVTDFGRIELHTHAFPSSTEIPDESSGGGAGGEGGIGVGVIGLIGGAIALVGRGGNDQEVAVAPADEDEKEKEAHR